MPKRLSTLGFFLVNLCIVCSTVNACMTATWSRSIRVFVNIETAGLWNLWTSGLTWSRCSTPRRGIKIICCWYDRIHATTVQLYRAKVKKSIFKFECHLFNNLYIWLKLVGFHSPSWTCSSIHWKKNLWMKQYPLQKYFSKTQAFCFVFPSLPTNNNIMIRKIVC